MKKTLVAVAAVVAATGAIAGNSVTLYGIADVYVGSVKKIGASDATTKLDSGGLSTSRLGVKVKEELGGGLYGAVKFERGLNVDTGMNKGPRETWLGLGGNFGELRLGHNDNSYGSSVDDFTDAAFGGNSFSPVGGKVGVNTAGGSTSAIDGTVANSIRYLSPNMDGFYGALTYGLDEDSSVSSDVLGMMLAYEGGPFGVSLGYNQDRGSDESSVNLGGYYDFGTFKLNAGVINHDYDVAGRDDSTTVNLGGSFVWENVGVSVGVARMSDSYANDKETTTFSLMGKYNLSKRTSAYAGFSTGKAEDVKNRGRLIAVGLRHKF